MSFQQRVFDVVKKIPRGHVLTYKKVAEIAGYPRAFRAVGNVLNKNRDKAVPCHRVVLSSGSIGGFSRGTKEKIRLLEIEGIEIRDKKVQNLEKILYR